MSPAPPDPDLVEWATVAPGVIIVATADRAVLHRPDLPGQGAFSTPMRGPGSPATTKNLLDGAVGAGQRAAAQRLEERRLTPPPLTLTRWVYRLAGYYRTTHATPRLMAEASARFAAAGREELARWAAGKAKDERGHDELALRDIRALGYRAEAVVEALVPESAEALVQAFTRFVLAPDPIGCVGYAYALERLALTRGPAYLDRIKAILPKGVDATRCLRVHSASGSDAAHVDETAAMVAGLSGEERAQIALATHETTVLCYLPPDRELISDDALKQALSRC
jgi:pyrroloquinoline quinone (PQQ) biosynthesis protein C